MSAAKFVARVSCSRCGKCVSGVDPELGLVVRAWVECPECIEKHAASDYGPCPECGATGPARTQADHIERFTRVAAHLSREQQQAAVGGAAVPPPLSAADLDQIIEGIKELIIGDCEHVAKRWRPCVEKLEALRAGHVVTDTGVVRRPSDDVTPCRCDDRAEAELAVVRARPGRLEEVMNPDDDRIAEESGSACEGNPRTPTTRDSASADAGVTHPAENTSDVARAGPIPARPEQEQDLRRLLWLNHHCPTAAIYGDDGEMQCNAQHENSENHTIGPLDFKRDDLMWLASAMCSMLRYEHRRAELTEAARVALQQQVEQLKAERAKGERVFQAVVYAFEGREVPEDLQTHGMVQRALKHRDAEVAALRARVQALIAERGAELVTHLRAHGISWNPPEGITGLWDHDGEPREDHPWIRGQVAMRDFAADTTERWLSALAAALARAPED